MTPTDLEEYKALRATIRERGATRVWVVLAGTVGWAALALVTVGLAAPPIATFIPLLILATTFEVAFALHTGVERIGRYIQVFFESEANPGWEHRIMAFAAGQPRPGTTDPLFARSFWFATVLNLLPALLIGPVPIEWAVIAVGHAAFIVRVAAARRQAASQRASDLQRFEEMKHGRSAGL